MTKSSTASVCIFCGSSAKVDDVHKDAARTFGRLAGERGWALVYGGGRVGLMGIAADAALEAGGKVIGVIPTFLQNLEVGHSGLDELVITDSMHDRKRIMYERADAFVVLPGGLGTLDETMEALTWAQLKLSRKPIIIVNTAGYWDPLIRLIDHTILAGFTRSENRGLFSIVDTPEQAFDAIGTWRDVDSDVSSKWL
jgi:uncharacterized protein (TIGR00730 family)